MRLALSIALAAVGSVAWSQFAVTEIPDIVYTQGGGTPQRMDLYLPALGSSTGRPGIIFVHGGGWVSGSKADFADWARYYAAQGYVCASIDYRLTPNHVWPAQIDDTQASVRFMRKWAPIIGMDPAKIAAIGASAGGHLVLFLSTIDTLNDADPDLHGYSSRVSLAVDYFGPTDFRHPNEWDPIIWQLINSLAGTSTSQGLLKHRQASPLTYVSPDDNPVLIFHGAVDPIVPVDQSRRYAKLLSERGVPHEYVEFPLEGHGFSSHDNFMYCLARTDVWLQKYLR
ncbi:MAG: Dipeptidyl aminopeptidase BIII [Fimbriimonadaceae bacterium]|nr:Dipeptidyl aminopeptidase BIII [Fimbriimonadaceae bacterium]